jgi:hypothetical protein
MNHAYEIRVERQNGIPLAVVRRQARQSELSRVVPECCGLVWNALRAQGVKGAGPTPTWPGQARIRTGRVVTDGARTARKAP